MKDGSKKIGRPRDARGRRDGNGQARPRVYVASRRDILRAAVLGLGAVSVGPLVARRTTPAIAHAASRRPPTDAPSRVPTILRLEAPQWVVVGQTFTVRLTAAAARGISGVDLAFGDQIVHLDGRNLTSLRLSARLVARSARLRPLTATAIDADGTRGPSRRVDVAVSVDDARPGPGPVDDDRRVFADYPSIRQRDLLDRHKGSSSDQSFSSRWWARPVAGNPWWVRWQEDGGGQPFDWKAACDGEISGIDAFGQALTCWLALYPKVALAMVWQEVDPETGEVTTRSYPAWSQTEKIQLNQAFYWAWAWLHGGLDTFQGEYLFDPPDNQIPLIDCQFVNTGLTHDAAWKLYLGTIAHCLAVEIGGFVPWSITGYTPSMLETLFHSTHFFDAGVLDVLQPQCAETHFVGYTVNGYVIPAPPTATFEFLVEQDIIHADQYQTIGHLLDWARKHMAHIGGQSDARNMEAYYQYRGDAPASRLMTGTLYIDPDDGSTAGPAGWSPSGCHGVAYFFRAIMRAANIPVERYYIGVNACGHAVPTFKTIGYTLSHGDDVYNRLFRSTPLCPPKLLLVSFASFDAWLAEGGCVNIGRRPADIALQLLPDILLDDYCGDVADGLGHADGEVFAHFSPWYLLADLEAQGLWTKLADKSAQTGACNP